MVLVVARRDLVHRLYYHPEILKASSGETYKTLAFPVPACTCWFSHTSVLPLSKPSRHCHSCCCHYSYNGYIEKSFIYHIFCPFKWTP